MCFLSMLAARNVAASAPPRPRTAMQAQHRQEAGRVIHHINQNTLSRGMEHKAVKSCFDQAAKLTFPGGHATVQSQGSTSKATALRGSSDWDFIVRLTAAVPTVTGAQRMQFLQTAVACMKAQGIHYSSQPGENRIRFYSGSWHSSRPLPEIDVVFQRFKSTSKVPPNNRAMAAIPNGHQVVRCIKKLPSKFTNLTKPKSMYVEDLVRRVEQQLPMAARQPGAQGFHALLRASLTAIATKQYKGVLGPAGLDTENWVHAAAKVLNVQQATGKWPVV